jgi:hypothetical protein
LPSNAFVVHTLLQRQSTVARSICNLRRLTRSAGLPTASSLVKTAAKSRASHCTCWATQKETRCTA